MISVVKISTDMTFLCCMMCLCIFAVGGTKNVRLVGSTIPLEGRVEVFYKGEWGTVCSNGWNLPWKVPPGRNMDVVCRELGFAKGRAISTRYPGTGTIWLDRVMCDGNEESIVNCRHKSWGDTSCPHSQDVGVECDVCQRPIISSNENLVNDWSFSATSYQETHPPHNARLKSPGSWCLPELRNMVFTHYLEVELPRLYLVSAVATLGGESTANYVTSYKIVYSIDGEEWQTTSVDGNEVIVGNSASGNENIERRNLDETIRARFLRFVPQSWGSVACMRVEICGHKLPHRPTLLVNVKSSSIVISWSKPDPGDDAIKTYYVSYTKMKGGSHYASMFESTATSAVVSNLSPFTDYELDVSGASDLGVGLSRKYTFRTLEAVPSGSPTAIQSTLLGTTAVNITWAPPDEDKRNGIITEYVVCFPQRINGDEKCVDPILVPGSKTWYVLRDVDVSVEHSVEIRAKTDVGTGPSGKGMTGILEYTAPEGVASSVIIAAIFGAIMFALIIVVILAAKGIILKNFVQTLRKLTSSQITISTESSQGAKDKKRGTDYEDPEATPDNPETTTDDLYNTSAADQHVDMIYGTVADVRRMTLNLETEDDIYGYALQNSVQHPLYESRDHFVYDARVVACEVPLPQRQDTVYDVDLQLQHQENLESGNKLVENRDYTNDNTDSVYVSRGHHEDTALSIPRPHELDADDTRYNPYDQDADADGREFTENGTIFNEQYLPEDELGFTDMYDPEYLQGDDEFVEETNYGGDADEITNSGRDFFPNQEHETSEDKVLFNSNQTTDTASYFSPDHDDRE